MQLKAGAWDLGLACLSAVLLLLSFPPFELDALAWVALVPLLLALEGKTLKAAFVVSLVSGLAFFVGLFYWIWVVPAYNVLDGLLLAAYFAPYVGLWGLGVSWIRKRTGLAPALVGPPLWVTLEYIRSHLFFLSLPWMLLGHSQYLRHPLIQITSLTGVFGLTFLIVLVNAALADALMYFRLRFARASGLPSPAFPRVSLTAAGLLLAATSVYGLVVLSRVTTADQVTIALVQGNVPQDHYWNPALRVKILDRYLGLTRDAARHAPTLIVWPETAVPGDVQHFAPLRHAIAQLAIETRSHLLVGNGEYAKFTDRSLTGKYHNSMSLFTPDGNLRGHYRKIALIPFGEYEPLRGIVKWPKVIVSAMGSFLPGDQHTVFTIGTVTFSAVICWESIFPDLVRQFVKQGARLIINATDESRFDKTAVPSQLLAMSAFRAVENGVAVARAANTGITAFIDPFGRITDRLHEPQGVLTGGVPLGRGGTFYTRYGDVFAFAQVAASAVFILLAVSRRATSMGPAVALRRWRLPG